MKSCLRCSNDLRDEEKDNSADPPAKKSKVALGEPGTSVSQGTSGSNAAQDIDEGLYSRQLYVLGHDAMRRMAKSDVLISGLGGLGVEIAKNVILSGVKSVTLHDETQCTVQDLTSQFYLTQIDIGENRADASLAQLSDLNRYVQTNSYTGKLTDEVIKKFRVVVLTNSSPKERLRISEITHANNIALIIGDTRGLFAQVFCDFGDDFTVVDTNGENPSSAMILNISQGDKGIVTCLDVSPHGLENGDYVTFSEIRGMTELNGCPPIPITVLGPLTFAIGDTLNFSEYTSGGIVSQVKMPKRLNFKPLAESLQNPEFVMTDFAKCDRPPQLHLAFATLHEFVALHRGALPRPWNNDDAKQFFDLAESLNSDGTKLDVTLLENFAKTSRGSLGPMNAIIGGIVAQEVMKACSGKFSPIYQWLYFDALECLPTDLREITEKDCLATGSRYDGQTAIFGKTYQDKLGALKYFVVGAGAIGCELLKNFAMMGVGAGKSGQVIVTDMDLIEKSNLNRQFLFRPEDVQRAKSTTAAAAVRCMNSTMNVVAHENRVGPETEHIYNDDFFANLNGVANALDNIEARDYMDQRCVKYRKSLLESGTLGTKGNTQVVIPHLTESYSTSRDPPEKDIPVCTLKNFPNAIEHTLQWARDLFDGLFFQRAEIAAQYLNDPEFMDRMENQPGRQQPVEVLSSIKVALVDQRPRTFQDCVDWARCYWQEQFSNQIRQLLFNFPADYVTTCGQPFWTGPKRCPVPLEFSLDEPEHLDFVVAAANLKAEVYGIEQVRDRKRIAQMVQQVKVPYFEPRAGVRIAVTDAEHAQNSISNVDDANYYKQLKSEIPPQKHFSDLHIQPLEFEKDCDTNFHVDFIAASSNLRAANYRIQPADRHKSKQIAGKIIPAIATTTSVVAGLVCLELLKLVRGHKTREPYKNGFVNLALPFIGFSEPIAPPKNRLIREWTLWDNLEIQGEITLGDFIKLIARHHDLEVDSVLKGRFQMYATYMPEWKRKERMGMTMSKIWELVSEKPIEPHVRDLEFTVDCTDRDNNYVEMPPVRYILPVTK